MQEIVRGQLLFSDRPDPEENSEFLYRKLLELIFLNLKLVYEKVALVIELRLAAKGSSS